MDFNFSDLAYTAIPWYQKSFESNAGKRRKYAAAEMPVMESLAA